MIDADYKRMVGMMDINTRLMGASARIKKLLDSGYSDNEIIEGTFDDMCEMRLLLNELRNSEDRIEVLRHVSEMEEHMTAIDNVIRSRKRED